MGGAIPGVEYDTREPEVQSWPPTRGSIGVHDAYKQLCHCGAISSSSVPDFRLGPDSRARQAKRTSARATGPAIGKHRGFRNATGRGYRTPVEPKTNSPEGQQTKRMFWIIPNFAAVSADTKLPPLTTRGKFALAMRDSVDYSSFVWAGMLAGQNMALRSYPELGNGAAGYRRYYWRAFVDQASESFFSEGLVPAVTHEDPRYYTLGHGGFFRRAAYALSRVVVTKTDSGSRSFNYSKIVGSGMEAGLSNFYYPPQERGLRSTAVNWAAELEAASLNNIIREFWPDIHRKMLRQK